MVKLAVGFVAVATLAAGIILRLKAPRPSMVAGEDVQFDINDLYEAGL